MTQATRERQRKLATTRTKAPAETILRGLGDIVEGLEGPYRDLHRHPELSFQEHRTAGKAADGLAKAGFEVTAGVGGTGVVGVLENGEGPTVMLRADMDALPVAEATGLPYASSTKATGPDGDVVPVMHACGHDLHVTWLLGAASLFASAKEAWRGTLVALFQPAEELGEGAQAMIDDGLFERFPRPDVILGQHVLAFPAGAVHYRPEITQSEEDNLEVRLIGRGGHGAWPEATIDPIVMAAATILRLQTIVSRETAAEEPVVVTVGAIEAGSKSNVIPDEAVLKINVRSFDETVRARVLGAIERIVNAEAAAAGAPQAPVVTYGEHFALTTNDPAATGVVAEALRAQFGSGVVTELADPLIVSEDFGVFGSEWGVPSVFWYVGGTDADVYATAEKAGRSAEDIPTNHSSKFAPVIHPTLEAGIEALVAASAAYLDPDPRNRPDPQLGQGTEPAGKEPS